jgi:hypothetical protein
LVVDPENRLAFLECPMFINNLLEQFKIGKQSIFESDEVISQVYISASISPPLKDIVSLKISQLVESGIFTHIFYRQLKRDFPLKPQKIGPEVLTIQHLSAGFVVICSLLLLCILVFTAEWLTVLMIQMLESQRINLETANEHKWTLPKCRCDLSIFSITWANFKIFWTSFWDLPKKIKKTFFKRCFNH